MAEPSPNLTTLFTSLLNNTNAANHAVLLSILQEQFLHHPSGPSDANPFTTNTTLTTGPTTSTNNLDDKDPEDTNILSQSTLHHDPPNPPIHHPHISNHPPESSHPSLKNNALLTTMTSNSNLAVPPTAEFTTTMMP
jgi:hypothetical protein